MKMLLLFLAVLTIYQLVNPIQAVGEVKNNPNTTTLYSFICDDEILQSMAEKLNTLEKENSYLRFKMDSINMHIEQQFLKMNGALDAMHESIKKQEQQHVIADNNSKNALEAKTSSSSLDLPSNCEEALEQSGRRSGVYQIRILKSKLEPFYVYCLADVKNGSAWTIIQRRIDGHINFFRKWADYQQGFGNLEREFFLGLDKIYALTQSSLHELWIEMEDFENTKHSVYYSSFAIGGASESYALNILGNYTGDVGDSFSDHAGYKFSTKDKDNDDNERNNCANSYTGAWWYSNCHSCNLNGQYLGEKYSSDTHAQGITWNSWRYTLKYVHMAIRSVKRQQET